MSNNRGFPEYPAPAGPPGGYPEAPPSYLEATSGGSVWSASPGAPPSPQQPYQMLQPPQQHYQPPEDELSVWFYAVDEDGNGHITADELQQALLDENCRPFSIKTCRTLVNMFDDNANGEIELSEFVQLYHYVRKWREIFLHHDADNSGTIELNELLDSLNTVHAPLKFSRNFSEQMLHRFGRKVKGQHCLNLDQFIALNAGLSRLASGYRGKPEAIESFLMKRLRDS